MKYDIIGDIHGHVLALTQLLHKLGYYFKNRHYQHPEGRKVIFLGDFIDRGPYIRETLQLVRAMTDNNSALAIMGNHEHNAIGFHTKKEGGGYIRKHNFKNILQHQETIRQFHHHEREWEGWIEWFGQLPLFIENDYFRVVHACWDENLIGYIRQHARDGVISDKFMERSFEKGTEDYKALETTLKGKEVKLPGELVFHDKDGTERSEARVKWWLLPGSYTYDQYLLGPIEELKGQPIPQGTYSENKGYAPDEVPVFFGHYWFTGEPELQSSNVACLDYSIAKGGKLAAYSWNGEQVLKDESLVS